jgi:hypothetical protein
VPPPTTEAGQLLELGVWRMELLQVLVKGRFTAVDVELRTSPK